MSRYTGPEPTLGALHAGHGWLWANCALPCSHAAALPLAPIVERLGGNAPAEALRRRLRCTVCGSRGGNLSMPSWQDTNRGWAKLPRDRMPEWARAWELRQVRAMCGH